MNVRSVQRTPTSEIIINGDDKPYIGSGIPDMDKNNSANTRQYRHADYILTVEHSFLGDNSLSDILKQHLIEVAVNRTDCYKISSNTVAVASYKEGNE